MLYISLKNGHILCYKKLAILIIEKYWSFQTSLCAKNLTETKIYAACLYYLYSSVQEGQITNEGILANSSIIFAMCVYKLCCVRKWSNLYIQWRPKVWNKFEFFFEKTLEHVADDVIGKTSSSNIYIFLKSNG